MSYKQAAIRGPFGGVVDNPPPPFSPPNAFDDALNFLCRKGRLLTRPRLAALAGPADGLPVKLITSYRDVSNIWHTLVLTTQTPYALTAGPTYTALSFPSGVTTLAGTGLPYSYVAMLGNLYFANGSQRIMYANGEATLKDANADVSAKFMISLGSRLVLANTVEPDPGQAGSDAFLYRVRWCKNGDPTDWTSVGSGFADLLETPDEITGLVAVNRNGVVFRKNGLTGIYTTGVGTSPFAFEQITQAPEGVGNEWPYSLANYGAISAFVAKDDIYTMQGVGNLAAIGGKVKDKIFADIADATAEDQVWGVIVPRLAVDFDFLSYWLTTPNRTWIYNFEEDNWMPISSSAGRLTAVNSVFTS